MNVFIDGAFGQDGTIIRQLLVQQYPQVNLILLDHKERAYIPHRQEIRIKITFNDTDDFNQLLLKYKPYIYINLAAIHASVKDMQSSSDNNNYLENSARSKKIIQSIVRFSPNTYFVYASSSLIFPSQGFQFVTSDCLFNPNTDYGIAKYEVMKFIDEQRTW